MANAGTVRSISGGLDQRTAPCRRHAYSRAVRTVQFPTASQASEYQRHSAQSEFAFCIGLLDRISHTTGEPDHRGILGNNVKNFVATR